MYPSIAFSPQAHLAMDVDAVTTVIPLVHGEYLPPGPNKAVILDGALSETVLYEERVNNELRGCTRGHEGLARNHAALCPVARFYTASDHTEITENLDYLYAQQPIGVR